jgi:glutamate/tyrosine decarboxylase-like PLP-dependent enzyme
LKDEYRDLLKQVCQYSLDYIEDVGSMPAFPSLRSIEKLSAFDEELPNGSSNPSDVLAFLNENGSTATTAQIGGRYFGFVNGGMLPISHAAGWLVDTWNQNSALYLMSPIAAKLEAVCEQWFVELLGLEQGTVAGLGTGSSNAIICALAAARNHLLLKHGYDVKEHGLNGAPQIRVLVNEQAHSSVWAALSILGFGKREITTIPVDKTGSIRLDALPELTSNTILIIQAGNVSGGAFDPIDEICNRAKKADAWVHIDGAFGLWAAASRKHRHLVAGLEKADSYSLDAHKTLNASYDCGIVLCRHRDALVNALHATGAYIHYGENRDGMLYGTEMSRRARSIVLWATLRQLGREGVEELVDSLCEKAEYFASRLEVSGFTVVNPVCFNQFICKCGSPEKTNVVLEQVQNSGICWCSGSMWNDEPVIRVSVCSHTTTKEDIEESVSAFMKAMEAVNLEGLV